MNPMHNEKQAVFPISLIEAQTNHKDVFSVTFYYPEDSDDVLDLEKLQYLFLKTLNRHMVGFCYTGENESVKKLVDNLMATSKEIATRLGCETFVFSPRGYPC